MTIEEMIFLLKFQDCFLRGKSAEIIAALRAGQAMRNEITVTQLNTTGYIAKPHGSAHSYSAGIAAEAWDAATKGEK